MSELDTIPKVRKYNVFFSNTQRVTTFFFILCIDMRQKHIASKKISAKHTLSQDAAAALVAHKKKRG